MLAHQDDLGALISLEQGKPLAEGKARWPMPPATSEWFGEEATRMNGEVIPAPVPGRRMFALKEPVGVVAAITPWNFPAAMIAQDRPGPGRRLHRGVQRLRKTSPLTSLALVQLAHEADTRRRLRHRHHLRQNTPAVVDVAG